TDGASNARERLHVAARGLLTGCGCALCEAALAALESPKAEEESADEDGASEQSQASRRAPTDRRLHEAALTRALTTGLRASIARLDSLEAALRNLAATTQGWAKGVAQEVTQGVAHELATAQAQNTALGRRVEALEAQPIPGGPAARPAEKAHPLSGGITRGAVGGSGLGSASIQGYQGNHNNGYEPISADEQYRALEALAGKLRDPQAQIAVAAELIRLRQSG
ncbi:MAG TPA: hypothetical protein VKQ36_00805, partial [Ktedonobacterales bacterium]|nr:hypothetical protein [Ktedonobacterales bacterium]